MTDRAPALERLSTGSGPLDTILGGGLPVRSVTVVAGEPGSGKTVFTLQALFHHARQGKKCLYFSTLSEPALKTIRSRGPRSTTADLLSHTDHDRKWRIVSWLTILLRGFVCFCSHKDGGRTKRRKS